MKQSALSAPLLTLEIDDLQCHHILLSFVLLLNTSFIIPCGFLQDEGVHHQMEAIRRGQGSKHANKIDEKIAKLEEAQSNTQNAEDNTQFRIL